MGIFQLFIILVTLSSAQSKPTTESTHALLKRLGFDPVQRLPINHHSKRVATETNKARYHNDFYNSDTDSRMFVVKLPPHSPYYSHTVPEKFKNEAVAKPSISFRTNGKPGQIYHWNIPVIKKLSQSRKGAVRKADEDSKVYRLKILPNQIQKYHTRQEPHKSNNKHKKHKYEEKSDVTKSSKRHRNKFYRFTDAGNVTQSDSRENLESRLQNISMSETSKNNFNRVDKNKNYANKKFIDKYANEVSKLKNKNHGPNYYVPAIPKQNSFHKYFTGNGKPKSFYVIEKSKKPSKLHRLL